MENMSAFEWPKMTQIDLEFLIFVFSGTFLNMFMVFLVCENNFYEP